MNNKRIIEIIVVLVVVAGCWYLLSHHASNSVSQSSSNPNGTLIASASYQCDAGKIITADFYDASSTQPVVAGQPPVPTGSVHLVLSDGRTMSLKQTLSADGVRYSDGDPQVQGSESFVFWDKGNGALVLENNVEKSYIGCVRVVPDTAGLSEVYESGTNGFSIRYPAGYTADDTYKYQELGPGKDISGVKFTIDPTIAAGTNLAPDSYVSVEELPAATSCTASQFMDLSNTKASTLTDNGVTYSFASSTGAGAGNRYEETVYAMPGSNPCMAVRYMVHYGVIENYPAGAVKAFDHTSLLDQFDAIRHSLVVGQ